MIKSILTVILSSFILLANAQQTFNTTYKSEFFPPNIPNNGYAERFNDIWGYVAPDGKEYAIFGSTEGTHFVDVSDPLNPEQVDFWQGGGSGNNSFWRDFKTWKHYAFGVADVTANNTLQIFDLQYLPDSVVKIYDDNEFSSNCHNVHVNNDKLYLISNTRGGSYYPLDILCIEDPANPELIGGIRNNVNVPGNFSTSHDAFVKNDTVFLSVYNNSFGNIGLHVFDCVDPENPQLLGSLLNYPGKGINHASWMTNDGTHMIMVDETAGSPAKMVNIQDLSNMQAVSTFSPNPGSQAMAHNPFIKDCLAFISYYHEGVQIYDISDPVNPNRVGFFDTDTTIGNGIYNPAFNGCWGVYPYLPSGNIIATDRKHGLFVFTYDGAYPTCNGDFDEVVEEDTTKLCFDTTTIISIQPQLAVEISVFPNPAEAVFNIHAEGAELHEFSIYDIRGVLIRKGTLNRGSSDISIDLSEEEDGIYLLQIRHSEGEKRIKLFKE